MEQQKTVKLGLQDLLPAGFTLIVAGLGLAFGVQILGDVQDGMTQGTDEYTAVNDTIQGLSKITQKMPTLGTVVVAAILIGVLVQFLFNRFVR